MFAPPAHWGLTFTKTLHNDIYLAIDPTKSDLSHTSKVVLITGAGRGIGRSIALRYAESGVACLILCARTTSQLDETEVAIQKINSTIKIRKLPVDITDAAQVSAISATVKNEEGRLDILVNNAGISEAWVPLAESDPLEYWRTWEVTVKGTYQMLHAFLPLLVDTAAAIKSNVNIVNIVSIGAHNLLPGASAYGTSRLALLRLGEFVDAEYGGKGVNCFSVHPGGVMTEMSSGNDVVRPFCTDTAELPGGFVVWLTKGDRKWLNARYLAATWDVNELEERMEEIVRGGKLMMRMVV